MTDELKTTNKLLEQSYTQNEQHHRDHISKSLTEEQQRCHQSFKTSNYEEHKNINPRKIEGTCQWAIQSAEYIRWWQASNEDLLWISADPGCGKSVLAKSIIDDFMPVASSDVTVCYFFFKDNDRQNTLATALCALLHQLFSQRPDLLHHAMSYWVKSGDQIQQEVDELWRILIETAETPCKVVCVLDALDECRENDQVRLIEKLNQFYNQRGSSSEGGWLKFLITSRPYDHIQDHFRVTMDEFPNLHLKGEEENEQIHKEIDLVVKVRIEQLATAASLSQEIQQQLEEKLLKMEHRTYLWLHLAIDDIQTTFKNSLRPSQVTESIQLIPQTVNEAYTKILRRVPTGQVEVARKILQIVVAARRPLTTTEMAMALGVTISPHSRTTEDAAIDQTDLVKKLRRLCGLFVFIQNSNIYLIHQTAREFLIKERQSTLNEINPYCFQIADAEAQMAGVCVRYLLLDDLNCSKEELSLSAQGFLDYSALHWPDHVRESHLPLDHELNDQIHQLYDASKKRFLLWFQPFYKVAMPYDEPKTMEGLHLAAFNGHEHEVTLLIKKHGIDVNAVDDPGMSPIYWAAWGGRSKALQTLLDHGADVDIQCDRGETALHVACSSGHEDAVEILLYQGADFNIKESHGETAIFYACFGGDGSVVKLLLDWGANANAQSDNGRTSMHVACSEGYDGVVKILLDRGADPNIQDNDGYTALHLSCAGRHDKMVRTLVDGGADVNLQNVFRESALGTACSKGDAKLARILLDKGAIVNMPGGYDGAESVLHAACSGGNIEIVQMLLERGADVNAKSGFYGFVLHAACSIGDIKMVQTLLDHGADVNMQGGYYETALQAACLNGKIEIAEMLLDRGADVNSKAGFHGFVLHAACSIGDAKMVRLLLERGADVNVEGGFYGPALHTACAKGDGKTVHSLLEKGASVHIQRSGRSALEVARAGNREEIVQMLLDRGAAAPSQTIPT